MQSQNQFNIGPTHLYRYVDLAKHLIVAVESVLGK
jgi:hypothetical protein